jgi:hypothetical protein
LDYLSCFKVVPEPGQRNWTISCHRIRPMYSYLPGACWSKGILLQRGILPLSMQRINFLYGV